MKNTIITILGLVIILLGLFLIIAKRDLSPIVSNENKDAPLWDDMDSEIKTLISGSKIGPGDTNSPLSLQVSQVADINNDGVDEALIETNQGGAASWLVAILQIKDDKLIFAKLKDADGSISDAILLEAGSASYASSVLLDEQNKSIVNVNYSQDYSINKFIYEGGYGKCEVTFYTWNTETEIYQNNPALGNQMKDTYCNNATP